MNTQEFNIKLFQVYSEGIINKQTYESLKGLINDDLYRFNCSFNSEASSSLLRINLELIYKTKEEYSA